MTLDDIEFGLAEAAPDTVGGGGHPKEVSPGEGTVVVNDHGSCNWGYFYGLNDDTLLYVNRLTLETFQHRGAAFPWLPGPGNGMPRLVVLFTS